MTKKEQLRKARQFAAFITEVAETMKKHKVEDCVCIFGMNGEIRNTYIPLGEKGEHPLYCNISDAFDVWLKQGGFNSRPKNKHELANQTFN